MDNQNLRDAIQLIQDTARLGDKPEIKNVPFKDSKGNEHELPIAFVADGPGKVKPVSLLEFTAAAASTAETRRLALSLGPDRRRGVARHQTLRSFVDHVKRFMDKDTAVWAKRDGQESTLVAIFNYHQAGHEGAPRWGDHRAEYPCPLSDAWEAWGAGEDVEMSQEDLAEFLEAHDYDLAQGPLPLSGVQSPSPAFMVTMANRLEVFSNATATRERDPNNNSIKISYQETKGVSGDIKPPPAFLIKIPVFEDSEPEAMEVRLNVKVKEAKAIFTLRIHNAEGVYRQSFEKIARAVKEETERPVFEGSPEQ